jgi:O-antigen ligase
MAWTGAALIAWFALAHLARTPAWRTGIAWAMLLAGAAVALLGLLQNATRARGIFWNDSVQMPGAFFGTFFHHTSAGAYLNSVWPLGFALALGAIRRNTESARVRILIYGSLVCSALILCAHSGHVSRLPQVIAIVVLVAFTFWAGLWRAFGQIRGLRFAVAGLTALLLIAVLGFGATRLREINARWNLLEWTGLRGGNAAAPAAPVEDWPNLMRDDLFVPSQHGEYPLGDRGAAYATAVAAIKERPWFGWGPQGWTAAAAALSNDPFIRTFYLMVQFTHSDYLQTCVEWGLIGAAGWALLIPASVVNAFRRLGSHPSHDFVGAAAASALVAVLVQSLIDFPLQIPAVFFNVIALSALAWSVPLERIHPRSIPPFPLS